MANDPYAKGKFKANPYAKKTDVAGELVVVLDGRMEDRGLSLIKPISRCVCKHEIHELILTDEDAAPGCEVNRIAYFGFCNIEQGGVILSGDEFFAGDRLLGRLAGFDETHMPNHLNIVIKADNIQTGVELGAELGSKITFKGKHL